MSEIQYRHEHKYPIIQAQCEILRNRLGQVMKPDPHAIDGQYVIRSLYFDDYKDTALFEKMDGTAPRAKFRIRIYNGSDDYIKLEKKIKDRDLTRKLHVRLTREECDRIITGDIDWMILDDRSLLTELYVQMRGKFLRPKTLVEYIRTPFVYEPGNVRVTLDCDIRSGVFSTELFSREPLVPTGDLNVLEVKYDRFLPDVIRHLISPVSKTREAFSKYEACRKFG